MKENELGIKPELIEEWKMTAGNNCVDPYSFGVVQGAMAVMGALANPQTSCHDAAKGMHGLELTGFMAGCVAQWVAKYSIRGDEFRIYWNKTWGVDESKAKGGTVNPAIMELKQ